ncbi:uncharacterized protein LOC120333755 [Styela clava]
MSVPASMTFMSFDMEQPLNKAHGYERVAEGFMKKEKWEEAEKNYILAAEMMRKALDQVSCTKIALPIRMQAEKFEKMRDVINIKQREANSMKNMIPNSQKSPHSHSKSGDRNKIEYQVNEDQPIPQSEEKTVDKSTETFRISKPKKKCSPANTWQFVPRDIIHLVQERETDSLLQFLNFPVVNQEEENAELFSSTTKNRKPKSQEAIIEEYRMRFQALQTTAIALVKALEDTENENQSLKSEVSDLRSEISNLSERLMVYEENRNYSPLAFSAEDMGEPVKNFMPQKFNSDPMAASMLIGQPENYFKFEGNDIASEIRQAAEEEFTQRKNFKSLPAFNSKSKNVLFDQWGPDLGSMDQSVRYEDLEEEVNAEVSETISHSRSDANSHCGVRSPLHYASIAGLPPLSPVHFELDEKDNIVTNHI